MQTVSVTIDYADRRGFGEIYWDRLKQARPKKPSELVLSFDLPAMQQVDGSAVYFDVPVWLLDNFVADALRTAGIRFTVK